MFGSCEPDNYNLLGILYQIETCGVIVARTISDYFFCLPFQVAVFAGGVDTSATETKGTVLIHNAEQVLLKLDYSNFVEKSYVVNIVVILSGLLLLLFVPFT